MTNETMMKATFGVPSAAWSRPLAAYVQKRFAMAGNHIDGWPLGPRDGKSG
jgi:hypothetical protein